jgi:hypothetical protein
MYILLLQLTEFRQKKISHTIHLTGYYLHKRKHANNLHLGTWWSETHADPSRFPIGSTS